MEILRKTMSQFSVSSQTNSYNTNTVKLRHSRKLSYEEVINPGTVDYLFALCAGQNASYRLERMRMLKYFQSIPDTPNTTGSENWANAVGGEVAGVRNAQPSFRTPWEKPNSGITFRYRHQGATPASSCSTYCTTFDHHEHQASIASSLSSTTTLNSPPTPTICDIPAGEISHILEHPCQVNRHTSSFPAALLPEVVKRRKKRRPLDLAGAYSEIARQVTKTKQPVGDCSKEQCSQAVKDDERDKGKSLQSKVKRPAEKESQVEYFQSICENIDVKSYLKENPTVYSSLPKEAQLEARRAENRKLSYQPPAVEAIPDEKSAIVKQTPTVSASIPTNAQFQAGRAELSRSHQRPNFLDRPGGGAHFKGKPKNHIRISQIQAEASGLQASSKQSNSNKKQVRFAATPRQRNYQRPVPEQPLEPPLKAIPERDHTYFKQYPNTFAGLKDPTEPSPDKRRVIRQSEDFIYTQWKLKIGPASGHCKEFIQQRDFNPLALRHTIDPQMVAMSIAIRNKSIIDARRGQPVPAFFVPKMGPPRPIRRGTGKVMFKPVFRQGPIPRPMGQTYAQIAANKRPPRLPCRDPVKKVEKAKKVEKIEKDQNCAIESSSDEGEWDPTCFVEQER